MENLASSKQSYFLSIKFIYICIICSGAISIFDIRTTFDEINSNIKRLEV